MKKRVGCLYRVSTLKQVEKDDIPLQKSSCREFIGFHKDWKLTKEYLEKGVSGYKIKEADRDVLQDIKKDVLNKKIDILLVFMFDRIGRRDDETPFVVEWLIKNGIEVWSVKEGQRKIENRVDKLMNYLTYWQAGGESEKTSIRVKESHLQMAVDGILTYGGPKAAPYGYDSIKSGIYSKKGIERYKFIINKNESDIVKKIYRLYIEKGYGFYRIATYLNKNKIPAKKGGEWAASAINNMISNPIYMGYPAYNKTSGIGGTKRIKQKEEEWVMPKEKKADLVIISEKDWFSAQKIKKDRCNNFNSTPKQTKSDLLFIGMIRCGCCGRKFMTAQNKKKDKNGNTYKYYYYKCYSKITGKTCTANKSTFRKEKIEDLILNVVYDYIRDIENMDLTDKYKKSKLNEQEDDIKALEIVEKEIRNINEDIDILKKEIVNTIVGKSVYSPDLLNDLINEKEMNLKLKNEEKSKIEIEIAQKQLEEKDIEKFKDLIPIWKEEFENADIEIKKMLLSEIIKEIKVYDEKILIDFRMKFENEFKFSHINLINNLNNKFDKVIEETRIIKEA